MIFEALVLGIVQGLAEFLPISSSGHLILAQWAAGWSGELINNLTFDVSLHVGTLLAVLWFFRRDWLKFGLAGANALRGRGFDRDARLAGYLVLATIPAAVIGMRYEETVATVFRNPLLVAGALLAGSLVMWAADRYSRKQQTLGSMTFHHALFVGIAQAIALIPGVSRSGITISAGLAGGYTREEAARFSFLLSTPVIAGAAVFKLNDLSFQNGSILAGFAIGILTSAVVGYLAIRFLIHYLGKHSLNLFVWYRVAIAVAVAGLWAVRT